METVEIKQLPPTINRRGAKYKLVKRGTKALIYARTVQGKTRSYEVFELKVRAPQMIKNEYIPANERFPHDEAFGNWAFSFPKLEQSSNARNRALRKFNIMETNSMD